jgi:hypothetical protein
MDINCRDSEVGALTLWECMQALFCDWMVVWTSTAGIVLSAHSTTTHMQLLLLLLLLLAAHTVHLIMPT